MGKFKDLTGMRFGAWTVIERAKDSFDNRGYPVVKWHCLCDCGSEADVFGNSLRSGRSTSCGCVHSAIAVKVAKELFTTHGESRTRLYKIWAGMMKRCYNQNSSNYPNYGGRGVSVCLDWHSYESFSDWAHANGYSDELSIDRINVDGSYSPDNCRWVSHIEQSNNRRSNKYYVVNGVEHTLAEWARIYDVNYKTLWKKINKGASIEEALITN